MCEVRRSSFIAGIAVSALLWAGCASSTGSGDGRGGSPGSGGSNSTGSGGSNSSGSGGSNSTGTGGSNTTGSGGQSSTGGSVGSGGSGPRGGSTGSGGRAGSTGSGGSATGSGGSASTGTGGSGSAACTISNVAASLSTKIPTVGIVTFSTSLSSPKEGRIDFGLDTNYGIQAPIDFTQTSNRTLLLGMKASKTYHYKITVSDGGNTCSSADQTIMTGALPNGGLPQLTVTTNNKSGLYGGFLVTGTYTGSKIQSFILDVDGDYVWWYSDGSDGCGTRMSFDGQYMWINNGNVPDGGARVHRVTMDGLTDTDFSTPFKGANHQLAPLPDGAVAFYAYNSSVGCDDVKVFPANGTPSSTAMTVVNSKTAHGGSGACHLNNIEYDPSDDTLVFFDLDNWCLTKVKKTGETVWVWGGTSGVTSTITGDLWTGGEHGFHIVSPTDYVIFNNNSPNASVALELTLDATAKKSTKKWSYTANPAIKVMVLGDVQRMTDNGPTGAGKGNTIVDYGTGNTLQEVDASGTVLQQIKNQYPFGYMEKRFSLYGKPTR